ncbi:carbohydrate sulfotransferase 10-like [Strongylocentrotus purpuratus]|uniref:Carbohydrate sulfotransferase n=1 Tax=Strongylocentrotus purpuratus TaxID=7668 RepID=A0A7M7N515_STRPU|nr:carbohydrate sulfotransferase 10-like [Strongylocentrotus purpuratus]
MFYADFSPKNLTEKLTTAVVQRSENKDTEIRTDEMKDSVEEFMSAQSEVNRLRRELILQKCAKHPELNQSGISYTTYRHIYFSDKHKLLYCFIPKVGCSNWKRVMMILNWSKKNISEMLSDEVHEHNGMKRLAELSRAEQQQKLQTYKKFIYVRNPFGRVVSAFNNKFGDIVQYRKAPYFQGFAKTIMKQFRSHATATELKTGENITWTEFVKFLTQSNRPFFDDHWEEMFKICSPCKIRYDYVGHLETVSEDAKYMLTDLQVDSLIEYPSKSNSHPTNSTAKLEKAFRDLPKDNLKKLWKIYEKDFEIFDYPKPDFIGEYLIR